MPEIEDKSEYWRNEFKKCQISPAYAYNNYFKHEDAPSITDADVMEMIKRSQRLNIKPRGHLYYPAIDIDRINMIVEKMAFEEFPVINVGPEVGSMLIDALSEYVDKDKLNIARPSFADIEKYHESNMPSHRPPPGPMHNPKRKKFKRK